MMTQEKLYPNSYPMLTLFAEAFPVSLSQSQVREKDLTIQEERCFFEIARIAAVKKPKYLFFENVPGLLNHNQGRTFETIVHTLDELGYDVCWQVLNSKNFGVPQSRNQVYIIGYNRGKCAGEVLSFTQTSGKPLIQRKANAR